jgi:hypothetical protein
MKKLMIKIHNDNSDDEIEKFMGKFQIVQKSRHVSIGFILKEITFLFKHAKFLRIESCIFNVQIFEYCKIQKVT